MVEILLDWSQTFGRANFQTNGTATGVVTDNLGPTNCVFPSLNMSMVLTIPPILFLCGWFCWLGICDPHPGYDILGVGVRPVHLRLLYPLCILLLFPTPVPLLFLLLGGPSTLGGDSTSVLSTYISSPSLGFTVVIIPILNDRLVLP